MKSRALILGIIVSALLLAAAGVLYTMAAGGGGQHYRASVEQIRQIERLSSTWNVEVVKVKADPFADFDSLTAFIPRMGRLKESLSDAARRIPDLPDRLANDIQVYLSAIDAKEERIERFKTGYAVVRNSVRFLPLAAANVAHQAEEIGDASLTRGISTLIQDVNLYLSTPTGDGADRLGADIRKLRENSVAYPPPLANALANLLAHAEVLLARHAPTETLFQEATSKGITDLANRLVGGLEFELARHQSAAANYEQGLLAVIGVLALFWIVLAVQQRGHGGASTAAPEDPARTVADAVPGLGIRTYEPLRAMTIQDEFANLSPGAIDREPAAAAAVSPAGMSAETALLCTLRSERVGNDLAAAAERLASRMDYLHRSHQKIHAALQSSDDMLELPDGIDLDEEIGAGLSVAEHARREVNAIADLARRLATYSSLPNGNAERDMVDINSCIEEVVAATRADAAASVSKRLGDVPEIFASRTEIRLLLAQILENSVRAVEGLEDRKATIKIDTARRNEEILITIIDNGGGITPERRRQIFRPFYTSRDGAMGLGLTLAGDLVKKYEGGIKVNSLPGQGTVTRITLPTGVPGPWGFADSRKSSAEANGRHSMTE